MVMSPIPITIQLSISRRSSFTTKSKGRPRPAFDSNSKQNYFLGAIASFAALATRNFTTVFALIWIGSPVWGLRPTRALRCAFTRRPRPGTTKIPFFFVSLIAVSARCSRNAAAVLLGSSVFSGELPDELSLWSSLKPYFLLEKIGLIPARVSYIDEAVENTLFYEGFIL